jgi:hypothetical protein
MPSPKDNAKASGDVHLPEIESEDLGAQGAHSQGAGIPGTQQRGRNSQGIGSPPRGSGHAGIVEKGDDDDAAPAE